MQFLALVGSTIFWQKTASLNLSQPSKRGFSHLNTNVFSIYVISFYRNFDSSQNKKQCCSSFFPTTHPLTIYTSILLSLSPERRTLDLPEEVILVLEIDQLLLHRALLLVLLFRLLQRVLHVLVRQRDVLLELLRLRKYPPGLVRGAEGVREGEGDGFRQFTLWTQEGVTFHCLVFVRRDEGEHLEGKAKKLCSFLQYFVVVVVSS